jgi:hypothetical protein
LFGFKIQKLSGNPRDVIFSRMVVSLRTGYAWQLHKRHLKGKHGTRGIHIQKMEVIPHPTKAGVFRIIQRNVGTWDIAPWNWKWVRKLFGKS